MIHVLKPGVLTTVQDMGRRGVSHLGVATGGAADSLSLRLANRLVGNRDRHAALEMTLIGPRLEFEVDTAIALVGGRVDARVDGQTVPMDQSITVTQGEILDIGPILTGTRTYLAVTGGVRVPRVLGSRSTDTLAGLGPPPLTAGDRVPIAPSRVEHGRYLRRPPPIGCDTPLRITLGPDDKEFDTNAIDHLLNGAFTVGSASDRTGIRLQGPHLKQQDSDEIASKGMITGAIQVPPDGQPIVLLPNHGPTGGYPIIGVVITADIPRAAQAQPGSTVHFRVVTLSEALAALRLQALYIRETVMDADTLLLQTRALIQIVERNPTLRNLTIREGHRSIMLRR